MLAAVQRKPVARNARLATTAVAAAAAAALIVLLATLTVEHCDSLPQAAASYHFRSPTQNARQRQREAIALLARQNGRLPSGQLELERYREQDLFQCAEPSRELYESFVLQYNRTFEDDSDKLERLNLFSVTLKRAILFNRVIQAEILKPSNYLDKPEIRNYHFVEPTSGERNAALWFADITDCELGLIKKTIFDIFYHLDSNDYAAAYRVLQLNKDFLPSLLTDDGFEQLANILLVRLFDRFRGDTKMNQLFAWPLYLKKLAAFAYNQRLANQPGHRTKMALVSFAYPAFFKDLKYNLAAINRTGDNLEANREHERYFSQLRRKFANLAERNKRLSIFRQRWSLVEQLNGGAGGAGGGGGAETSDELLAARSRFANQQPEWQRVQYKWDAADLPIEYNASNSSSSSSSSAALLDGFGEHPLSQFSGSSARLQATEAATTSGGGGGAGGRGQEDNFSNQVANSQRPRHFKLTQFSDLTDLEFVAFLSNDFSLLGQNRDSADYLERNFRVRPLDARLRWELAHELELRRSLTMSTNELAVAAAAAATAADEQLSAPRPLARTGLKLAKQVIDELISDVGLPIGPASLDNIQEDEYFRVFDEVSRTFRKLYAESQAANLPPGSALTTTDLNDERQRRYLEFKQNYARFRAWMMKEAWNLNSDEMVAMLRLADLSWLEIKLTLFRVCCLNAENMRSLSSFNVTIAYLGSNSDSLCNQMAPGDVAAKLGAQVGTPPLPTLQDRQREQEHLQLRERHALELYYYYSVHFNKHHSSQLEFARRFQIFRRNIDAIRHHSCVRSLTLYESLRQKRPEILSTIDVIDARRSHTDDLNLDRFEYFKLPTSLQSDLMEAPPQQQQQQQQSQSQLQQNDQLPPEYGRVGSFGYGNRANFSQLLSQPNQDTSGGQPASSVLYADKLVDLLQDSNVYARRYRENSVNRVYDLVMARYKFCRKNFAGIDPDASEQPRQQCLAEGPLSDGASGGALGLFQPFRSLDDSGVSGRLLQGGGRLQSRDSCAYYREGLEPWAAGLIRQDPRSVELIVKATCA